MNILDELRKANQMRAMERPQSFDLADLLANIIIAVDLVAAQYHVDLSVAVTERFNRTSQERGFKTRFTIIPELEQKEIS